MQQLCCVVLVESLLLFASVLLVWLDKIVGAAVGSLVGAAVLLAVALPFVFAADFKVVGNNAGQLGF